MDYINDTLRTIVENGTFGPAKFISTSTEDDTEAGTHFLSSILFVTVEIEKESKSLEKIPLVIKMQTDIQGARDMMNFDYCFRNEINTYRHLFPILDISKIDAFPKFLHGIFTEGEDYKKDLIVLEDLREYGFDISKEKIILSKEHLLLALGKLGEFHGLSLSAKKNPKFYEFCSQLSLSKFETVPNLQLSVSTAMKRGILPHLKKGAHTELLNKFIDELNSIKGLASKLFKPEEPFAVLCHGDFNRNNILFKYDTNGNPVDVRFFDLQNTRYTSPAIDITFILYMNTTSEDRQRNWDEYLATYWNGLIKVCPDPGFNYDQFYKHFNKRALFGYIPCSFFLPCMMQEKESMLTIGEMADMSEPDKIKYFLNVAGEEATKAVTDIVGHLLERKSIENYFEI